MKNIKESHYGKYGSQMKMD